jgi:hypothetical protein
VRRVGDGAYKSVEVWQLLVSDYERGPYAILTAPLRCPPLKAGGLKPVLADRPQAGVFSAGRSVQAMSRSTVGSLLPSHPLRLLRD